MAYARHFHRSPAAYHMRPACDKTVINGTRTLTAKQLEDFNALYGHLDGDMYLGHLASYTNRHGFVESNYQIN